MVGCWESVSERVRAPLTRVFENGVGRVDFQELGFVPSVLVRVQLERCNDAMRDEKREYTSA